MRNANLWNLSGLSPFSNSTSTLKFLLILLIASVLLISCQQPKPIMVNVREKDTNKTGERYYEDWKQMEVETVNTYYVALEGMYELNSQVYSVRDHF